MFVLYETSAGYAIFKVRIMDFVDKILCMLQSSTF